MINVKITVASIMMGVSLYAQDPAAKALQEVVISAARLSDSASRAPSSITVLTPKELVTPGFADISNAVNKVPGVLMQSGALNTNRISVRGIGARTPFGTNRIRAFYGPIPLTSGDGETTIEDLDIESLGNIEFVRGPRAAVYGAGLGGAILISPALPPDEPVGKINTTHGSYGLRKNAYSVSARNIGLHYHLLSSNGWRKNSQYRREGATLTSHFPAGNGQFLVLGNYTAVKAFIPSSLNAETFENNPRAAAPTWFAAKGYEQYDAIMAGAGYERTTGKIRPSIAVFASAKDAYEPRPFDILDQQSLAWGARAQVISKVNIGTAKFRLSAGAEYFNDQLESANFENLYQDNDGNGSLQGAEIARGEQSRSFANAFAQAAADWGPWGVQAGINLNTTTFENSGASGDYTFSPIVSPEIAVSYTIASGLIYVSAGKGFSLPSVQETLDTSQNFNRSLQPEDGLTFEAGAKLQFWGNKLRLEAAAFNMNVRDLLVARRIGDDQYVGINAGRTSHRGIELLARYSTAISNSISMSGYLSGSTGQFRFEEFTDRENDYSGNRLTGVPDTKFAAGMLAKHQSGIYIGLDGLAVGRIPVNDANSLYADSYKTIHARAGWQRELIENFAFEAAIGVSNLFNEHYASMVQVNALAVGAQQPRYFYPGMPANVYFHVGLAYRVIN